MITYRLVAYQDDELVLAYSRALDSIQDVLTVADMVQREAETRIQEGVEHHEFMEQLSRDVDPAELADDLMDDEIARQEAAHEQ